jgi:hypothetical protein
MKSRRYVAAFIVVLIAPALGVCHADVPTPEQECRYRNAAECEQNGVKYVVEGDCPSAARTLRPRGTERCEDLARPGQRPAALRPAVVTPMAKPKDTAPPMRFGEILAAYLNSPFLLLGTAAFLIGSFTRTKIWKFALATLVLPLLATWAMLSRMHLQPQSGEYQGYFIILLFGTVLYSGAGWSIGAAARKLVLRISSRAAG